MSLLKNLFKFLKTPLTTAQFQRIDNFYLFKKKSFVVLIILISFAFFLIKMYPSLNIVKIDDPSYYVAAIGIKKSVNIYELSTFTSLGEKVLGKSSNVLPYVYPPLLAEIFTIFSGLDYQTYTQILFLFNMLLSLLLLIGLFLLFHSEKHKSYFPTIFFFFLLNINTPVTRTIHNGQVNLLILNLLIFAFFFYKNNKFLPSSFCLGLACLIKIFPLIFLLIFLAKKKIKYFIFFTMNSFLLVSVSILFYGEQIWRNYLVHFFQNFFGNKKTIFSLLYSSAISNNSLRSFFNQLSQLYNLPANLTSLVSLLLSILIFAATCFLLMKYKNNLTFSFSLLIICYILISPLSWVHHYVLVIVPLYYLVLKIVETQTFHNFFFLLPLAAIIEAFPVIAGFPFNQFRLLALIAIYLILIFLEKIPSSSLQSQQ